SFSFIVFDLGSETARLIEAAGAFAGAFGAPVDGAREDPGAGEGRSMKVHRVVNLFNPTSRPVPISSCEPFVIPYSTVFSRPVAEASEFIRSNPRSAPALPIHRLAHKLLGTAIGLAMGGGAAFG